ncbi:AAA family ATPase [Cellulosimicrobium protaetiae]|uniref:AAA family ATPase n=1 Tax=Cellulosimicrobium protaetiae TaxID=2587808 RepID=A0A6M5U9J0_9MICO|nr:LuxR family transcriptional regulator [Cellulosimicrobium protaetiae]QJW35146.1 AAA family ATPase [Cellulosimicrobium protaetiae]
MGTRTAEVLGQDLVGRERELHVLDDLLAGARAGHAQVVVLRGDAGVGKTALLRRLEVVAHGCTVLRVTGARSESGLAYAGLHQLVAPMSSRFDRLPRPQAAALRAALGLGDDGRAPDPFLVGLAVLGLLTDSGARRPTVCLVDDAHRLDPASIDVLAFVCRRLAGDAVLVALATSTWPESDVLEGFPELEVTGLADRDARRLLQTVVPGPLDDGVLRRVVSEAGGNPRVLLDVSHGLAVDRLGGGIATGAPGARPREVPTALIDRIERLPEPARRLLLVVAAEPRHDPVAIWRAASSLGLGPADAAPAEADGLLDVGGARFDNPLVRSAVYRHAAADERRAAHQALAGTTDPELDPDRHVWHLAHATAGYDEDVAVALERSAERAVAHGGLAAAAAIRELAVGVTREPGLRAERALRAAEDMLRSGALARARQLLAVAEATGSGTRHAADVYRLRAHLAALQGDQEAESLLAAARRLEPVDPTRARTVYRDAFATALVRGRLARRDGVVAVARAVGAARARSSSDDDPTCALLGGLASTVVSGPGEGAPELRAALDAFVGGAVPSEDPAGWLALATLAAGALWDDAVWRDLSARTITVARANGRLPVLLDALTSRTTLELLSGDLPAAQLLAREAAAVATATHGEHPSSGDLLVAAWRGDEHEVAALVVDDAGRAADSGDGAWSTLRSWSSAVLHNARRDHARALAAAEEGSAHPEELPVATWSAVELVEAAARAGAPARGRDAARRVAEVASASGTDWAAGAAELCRALVSAGTEAEKGYRGAIDRLSRTPLRFVLARAHLLYGEWLRGADRRADAREQLGRAHEMFAEMGAQGFADRARRELVAAGVHALRRSGAAATELTEQEAEIARLTALGHTNPEIAARLFLSPRTVEWHLRKIFSKLGVGSRKEVRKAIGWAVEERMAG